MYHYVAKREGAWLCKASQKVRLRLQICGESRTFLIVLVHVVMRNYLVGAACQRARRPQSCSLHDRVYFVVGARLSA